MMGRNDMVACIAMQAAIGIGKRVPADIGVVGFDNSSISRFCSPKLTTLEMQISRTVIDMMVQMIGGQMPENATFETKLIIREST
jgi:DNA-binding LacI/PurR family transcriptional regulator